MAQDKSTVKEKLAQALAGDKSAAAYFDLGGNRDVGVNLKRHTTWEGLNKDYHNFAVQWRAARCLKLASLEHASKTALIYLSCIAVQQFDKEGTDEVIFVTEREVLLYMKVLMDKMMPAFQNEEGSDSQDRDLVQVTSEDNSSDISDAEPPRKKEKESASEYSSKKKNTQEKKTMHHKVVKCRLPKCNYFGGNLTRHLQTHVKKGEIRKSDIPHLSSVMSQGKKQRGPRKVDRAKKTTVAGRRKKWCPYQHCAKVVTYLTPTCAENMASKKIPWT